MRWVLLSMLCVCAATAPVRAQAPALTAWSEAAQSVSPAAAAQLAAASASSAGSPDALSQRPLERARWLIGVGAAVVVATTITYAFAETRDCGAAGDYDKTLLRTSAAMLLAGGGAMVTVGGIRLAGVPASVRARHASPRLLRFGRAMTAIAAGATAAVLTGASAWHGMSGQDYCFNN